ncbi:hypothetical protein Hanom_Chr07g00622581 [Helianthus anomalus]
MNKIGYCTFPVSEIEWKTGNEVEIKCKSMIIMQARLSLAAKRKLEVSLVKLSEWNNISQ